MYQKQQIMKGKGSFLTSLSIILLLTILTTSKTQARGPTSSDCMNNPFASGCRGISAKRSVANFDNAGGHQSATSSNQWQFLNRMPSQLQPRSLSDLLLKPELASSAAAAMEQMVVSRPIIGRFYLYEPQPTTSMVEDHSIDLLQSHEEH